MKKLTGGPSSPASPFSPGAPAGPRRPASPCLPGGPPSPLTPLGPSLPGGPAGPAGPGLPWRGMTKFDELHHISHVQLSINRHRLCLQFEWFQSVSPCVAMLL